MTVMARLTYPTPPTADQVDDYHGTRDRRPVPAARGQRRAGDAGLDRGPERADRARPRRRRRRGPRSATGWRALWDFPRAGAPWRRGDRWFQLRNTGLQDQDVLWTADAPDAEGARAPRPERAERGGHDDARRRSRSARAASSSRCAISDAGSDWRTWTRPPRRDRRGAARPDRVEQVHARPRGPTTTPASSTAATRSRRPTPPTTRRTATWSCATTGSARTRRTTSLVFATPARARVGLRARGLRRRPAARRHRRSAAPIPRTGSTSPTSPTASSGAVVRPLLDAADAHYEHDRDDRRRRCYLLTDRDAPLGRVIAVDVDDPARVREVIPEGERRARARRASSGTGSPPSYLHHAHHRLALFELDGRHVMDVALPGHRHRSTTSPGAARTTSCTSTFVTLRRAADRSSRCAMADGAVREVGRPDAGLGSGRLRERAGVRHLRRRDARAAVPDPAPRRRARRRRPDAALRLRRLPDRDRPRRSSPSGWPGWSAAGCSRWRRCAAAPSTARPGTTPAGWRTSRTCSTTSRPAPDGSRRPGWTRAGAHRRSAAARTAGCWSARASPSTRSCSARRSPRSA